MSFGGDSFVCQKELRAISRVCVCVCVCLCVCVCVCVCVSVCVVVLSRALDLRYGFDFALDVVHIPLLSSPFSVCFILYSEKSQDVGISKARLDLATDAYG